MFCQGWTKRFRKVLKSLQVWWKWELFASPQLHTQKSFHHRTFWWISYLIESNMSQCRKREHVTDELSLKAQNLSFLLLGTKSWDFRHETYLFPSLHLSYLTHKWIKFGFSREPVSWSLDLKYLKCFPQLLVQYLVKLKIILI